MFDTFGGGVAQPSDLSYRAVSLTANVTLVWPSLSQTSTDVVARIMDVTPSGAGLAITMPDATQRSTGQDVLYRNLGGSTFTVKKSDGSTLTTVAASVAIYIYLSDNSTSPGTWQVVTFGTGTSSADAATLAGFGLKAIGITLNQKHDVAETSGAVTVADTDRARTYVWTSGTVNCNLPTAASVGSDFFFIAKNGGSGTVTIQRSGADTIDGATSLALAPNDGVIVYSAGSANRWYTVAQGRAVNFAFTQLVKSVAGSSTVTLTSAECANKIITFTGLLTGNISVEVTNTVSVYYVFNNTTGAFTLTLKTVAGTGITIVQGSHDVAVCDAVNVYRAVDNTAATTLFSSGSESAPSISFIGDSDTGFYQNAANKPAVTAGGTDVMRWNTVASAVNAIDVFPSATTTAVYMQPFGGDANVQFDLSSLGTGNVGLYSDGHTLPLALFTRVASAVNYLSFAPSATGLSVSITAAGTDSNITFNLATKGTGAFRFFTNSSVQQLNLTHTASAVNYWALTGSATGNRLSLSADAASSDGNVGIALSTKGTGTYYFTGEIAVAPYLQQTLSTASATINWNMDLGGIADATLGASSPYTMAAPTVLKKGTYILHLIQDGTGSRTIGTWNAVFKWPAATPPVLSTVAGRRDIISFVCDGTNLYGSFLPDVR